MARTYGSALGQAITLKTRTDELAGRLRTEMLAAEEARRLADEARRAAEAANRAKTQFFAAASHDLRQPLHAMGLFAEALRQRSHDPEVSSLVNSINESVDALEGLFGELLDITRIDTGGVDVNPAPVRLRELFQRLRLHFEPVAFEKGLMLSFRGEGLVAHADPVLLERVLRNLVSNAIRYTDDGGVLVSARLRQRPEGPRLLVQVWDSGIGISEASLPRIWEEFFQAQSNRPLEAHQRKGLGLGLAIVKRLSVLMEAPIAVRSRLGHGPVFSLEVPLGKAPRGSIESAPAGPKMPIGLTLDGRFIVVVVELGRSRRALGARREQGGGRAEVEHVQAGGRTGACGRCGQRVGQLDRIQVKAGVSARGPANAGVAVDQGDGLDLADGQRRRGSAGELADAQIVAPFDGIVTDVSVVMGGSGGSATIVMSDVSQYHVDVLIDETEIGQVQAGQTVNITFDALPDAAVTGRVPNPAGTVSNGVVNYTVRVDLDATDAALRTDMTANVSIVIDTHTNALAVPGTAMNRIRPVTTSTSWARTAQRSAWT